MAGVIDSVNVLLSGAGYRTGDAAPGRVVPEITEPVVALNLEGADTTKKAATVRATVVSPLSLGMRACQDEAMNVGRLLQRAGAVCEMEPYKVDAKAEVYMLPVLATFYGNVLSSTWQLGKGCRAKIDSYNLDRILCFTAWRELETETSVIQSAIWHFRIEEQMDGFCWEAEPVEPFVLTVSHENAQEIYTGCVITSHKRVLTDGGLVQIREGTATGKTITL